MRRIAVFVSLVEIIFLQAAYVILWGRLIIGTKLLLCTAFLIYIDEPPSQEKKIWVRLSNIA